MHCWFIQNTQQLQRKKWAQCTHGCYKMNWSYFTSEAISYDGQRPSSVCSSLLNQVAVTWFVIRVWIRASPYLLKILVEALAEGSGGCQESCHCGSTTLIQNALQKSVHEKKCINWYTEVEVSWAEIQVVLVLWKHVHCLKMQLMFTNPYTTLSHFLQTDMQQVLTLIWWGFWHPSVSAASPSSLLLAAVLLQMN